MTQSKPTIVIADDDATVAAIVSSLFSRLGYPTKVCADGEQVTDELATNQTVGALILDPLLPFTDGTRLIRHIRHQKSTKYIPVILLSNRTQEQNVVDAFRLQVNDVLSKPFQPRELVARVLRWVGHLPLPPYNERTS